MSRLACLVAVAMGLAAVAGAQESRGTIQGTVKDPQGAIVANASVVVTNVDTKTAVNTRTSEVGRFSAASDARQLYGDGGRSRFQEGNPAGD